MRGSLHQVAEPYSHWGLGKGLGRGEGILSFGCCTLKPGHTGAVGERPHLSIQRALEALLSSQLESEDSVHSLQPRPDSSAEEPGNSFSARASERSWKQAEYKL